MHYQLDDAMSPKCVESTANDKAIRYLASSTARGDYT